MPDAATAPPDSALDWPRLLDEVISAGWVSTDFQPIVDLRRRTIAGYEALARFEHPDAPGLAPSVWFDAAHRQGAASRLEVAALRSALARRSDLPRTTFLTINLEPTSIGDPAVRSELASSGSLGGIVVEITERQPLTDEYIDHLQWLRDRGALLAIDDTGAGYSGLQQILRLRPSFLKLDRELISNIDVDEARAVLVEMIGVFAGRIDAWIVAEGVETLGEAQRLVDLGVPLAQGFLFARPGLAWPALDSVISDELRRAADTPADTLHRLVEPVPARPANDPSQPGSTAWIPVVDSHDRPLGLEHPAVDDGVLPALIANVASSPREVADRVATGVAEPFAPVIVVDNAGRYVGIVTLRRLLARLAAD